MAKGIQRQIKKVREKVSKEIADFAESGGKFSHGLAGEGYNGGYQAALDDVMLALDGVMPNRNDWWEGSRG